MKRIRVAVYWLVVMCLGLSVFSIAPPTTSAQYETPSIRVTKKTCDNASFPVFVESHCVNDDTATFQITTQNGQTTAELRSGLDFLPSNPMPLEGDRWYIEDTARASWGFTVLSCLQYRPGDNVMLGVAQTTGTQGGAWDVEWMDANTGDGSGADATYMPSLECIWFDLPNIPSAPSVLHLQAFTASSAYMLWTDASHTGLGEFPRGESGEDLEANMVMSHTTTGAVYSFAADNYGQVLVPAGDYWVQNTDTGSEATIAIGPYKTVLTEIGLGSQPPSAAGPSLIPMEPEIAQWGVAVRSCRTEMDCDYVDGVTVYYESVDGSTSGSCVTEGIMGPGGRMGMCSFDFVWGVPVLLTLDTTTLPPGTVLTSANPIEFMVEPNLGGDPHLPVFMLAPQ